MIRNVSKYILVALFLGTLLSFSPSTKQTRIESYRTTSIAEMINAQRKDNNLPNLVYSNRLANAAYTRAISLSNNNQWSHDGFQEAVDAIAKSPVLYGENLGMDIPNDATLVSRWMTSPSHRENVLSTSYKYFGFARYKNYAVLWFSQEY
jgi:uncharacterized protein YkwD